MDWYTINFLSAEERTKSRLDTIADKGGIVGVMQEGFACQRGEQWEAHGYRAVWMATKGVGNAGTLVLTAQPGTPQDGRLARGQAAKIAAMVEEKGVDACLRDGIYNGDERPFPGEGIISTDWGWRTKNYIPFPLTEWRTRVTLVPRSEQARWMYLHARYERILDMLENFNEKTARSVWAALFASSARRIAATDEAILFAARTSHLPASAWDRHPPYSHAAAAAWADRWAVLAPVKLDDWVSAKMLNETPARYPR